jgi:hypothetical protein
VTDANGRPTTVYDTFFSTIPGLSAYLAKASHHQVNIPEHGMTKERAKRRGNCSGIDLQASTIRDLLLIHYLVSLCSGWRIPKHLPGQLQVALVQGTMLDGVQQRITHRHRLFIDLGTIVSRYPHGLIQPFVRKHLQQLVHSSQPTFVACCYLPPCASGTEF